MTTVAIIGAGISGVACAYRLEQLGFDGDIHIFEEKNGSRDCNTYAELNPEILLRPIQDYITYLSDNYGLLLKPATRIFHSKNYGPTKEAEFYGFLGHVVLRGGDENSVENQMRRQIKTSIQYGRKVNFHEIEQQYDYVVVATGNWDYLPEIVRFRIDAHVAFHYAIVEEKNIKISANQVEQWWNKKYAPSKGYAYKIPLSEGKAMMTCTGIISQHEDPIKEGWERFKQEQIYDKYEILEEHHIHNYLLGIPDQVRIGNVFVVGANAGCNNPFLGFGQFKSMLSGIYAADSIVNGEDYIQKMKFIRDEYERGLAMLKRVHMLGDVGYDLLIQAAATDLASSFMQNGAPNVMDWLSRIAKWTAYMDNDHKEYLSSNDTLNVVEHIDYHDRDHPHI